MSSFIAAGTAYANHGINLIPFYCFYSMFGFQRTGDFAWAGADMRMRGFLMGRYLWPHHPGGEGLQHQDGHSHLLAANIPTCVAYDPTFAYEMAVIVQDGLRRMVTQQEDVFYYITMMNENYAHPAMPAGVAPGILKGLYLLRESRVAADRPRVQLLGSGAILREVIAAADLLEGDFAVGADVWSVPSFTELRREGLAAERWSLLHPEQPRRLSFVETCLANRQGPVVAATDYVRLFADQIRPFVSSRVGSPPAPPAADHRGRVWEPSQGSHVRRYVVLGTDGFGRSDPAQFPAPLFRGRPAFHRAGGTQGTGRRRYHSAVEVSAALRKLEIDPEKADSNPRVIRQGEAT